MASVRTAIFYTTMTDKTHAHNADKKGARFEFPEGFLWGASTASHQVEGNTKNQWSEWELSPGRLADLKKTGLLEKYGRGNFISGIAADHYHLYESDFALAEEFGHTATRLSLEWSAIEPEEGVFDEAAIEHYRDVIASVKRHGMEPFVTLWHWTMPLWFYRKGGFEKKENARYFVRFAERMVAELDEVRFWITLNEPEVYAKSSYVDGLWPPQKRGFINGWRVFGRLARAHCEAYRAIKRIAPDAQVGVAKSNSWFEAAHWWDIPAKWYAEFIWNDYFIGRIRDTQDFIGLNFYFHNRIENWHYNRNENVRTSDLGWDLSPATIYHVLMDLKRYRVPVYITENGLADAADAQRPWFLRETLKAVHRAIRDGVDVRGYLHWSLMDNFEWAAGFWPRFGLIEIDYATQKRTPRPSAYVYRDIIKANAVEEEGAEAEE